MNILAIFYFILFNQPGRGRAVGQLYWHRLPDPHNVRSPPSTVSSPPSRTGFPPPVFVFLSRVLTYLKHQAPNPARPRCASTPPPPPPLIYPAAAAPYSFPRVAQRATLRRPEPRTAASHAHARRRHLLPRCSLDAARQSRPIGGWKGDASSCSHYLLGALVDSTTSSHQISCSLLTCSPVLSIKKLRKLIL